jgi:hypothetical protein
VGKKVEELILSVENRLGSRLTRAALLPRVPLPGPRPGEGRKPS